MLTRAQVTQLKRGIPLPTPNNIALAMKLADVTQVQIAEATGLQQSYISRIMRGRYSRLPGETMRTLATFFGCAIEDLFPAREEMAS